MNKKNLALVVDDSNITRVMVSSYLKVTGFDCDLAEDGIEAIKKLSEKNYNIIFSDVEMPNMNGLEFLRKIKNNSNLKNIPVIMLTTLSDIDTINKIKHLGGTHHMVKPYTREKMTEALKEAGLY